jgi:hypothetical protein
LLEQVNQLEQVAITAMADRCRADRCWSAASHHHRQSLHFDRCERLRFYSRLDRVVHSRPQHRDDKREAMSHLNDFRFFPLVSSPLEDSFTSSEDVSRAETGAPAFR